MNLESRLTALESTRATVQAPPMIHAGMFMTEASAAYVQTLAWAGAHPARVTGETLTPEQAAAEYARIIHPTEESK